MPRFRIPPAKRTSARVLAAKLAKHPANEQVPGLKASDHDDFLIDFGTDWFRISVETYHSTFKPWAEERKRAAEAAVKMIEPDAAGPVLHPATAELVDRFVGALKEKLLAAQIKHADRAPDAWAARNWQWWCQTELIHHIRKGDPLDVAAYAAFHWHHGWPTNKQLPLLQLPQDEPFTCGTAHVAAQAVLQLAEPGLRIGNAVDAPMLEKLEDLINQAGLRFALKVTAREDDDVPF